MTKRKYFAAIVAGLAITIASIVVVSSQNQPPQSNPIPEIRMIYNGHEYAGGLLTYRWKDSGFPAPNEHPHYDYHIVNVTKDSEIEFAVRNGTSPTYYAVSVADTLMHPPLGRENAAIVMDNIRLNGSKMTVDFGNSNYFVQVAGTGMTFDLSGKHEDHVTYGFMVKEE